MKKAASCVAFALLLATACDSGEPTTTTETPAAPAKGETVKKESREGPVTATISITPSEPRLGDTMLLTLDVTADPGVDVEMPSFGEALGRFTILGFTPRKDKDAKGAGHWSQEYRLQAAASGRLRIPPLRIVFVDGRGGHAADAGTSEQEILTQEIPIQVASVLPDDDKGELRSPLDTLDPVTRPSWLRRHGFSLALAAVLLGTVLAFLWRRRARLRFRPVESPYDAAVRRLVELEGRGMPTDDEVDAWYVELSAVVRRYLEGRFALRAPELTTEEFLRVAQRSERLDSAHKTLLADFLAGCDRVKFAGYRPDESESLQALESARRFIEETRPVAGDAEADNEDKLENDEEVA